MSSDEKTVLMPRPESVAVGTQLSGTYQLDARIASGGMGEVFRGHNIHTQDAVAIKIVLPEFARDATILALFRKEASILKHLAHEAIVRYEIFTIDQGIGRPYLAMEFVDGLSLADMFSRGPMDPRDARKLLFRLASGLAAAHEAGIIHRDLSPDNIILPGGDVGRAKIIDFGIARSATIGGETLIGGTFAGKYNFVSPEQLGMATGEVTERSDIYALGLVLCAALLGGPIDMGGSQVDVIDKRRGVPDLSGVEPDLRGLLEAMLQPDPADRPAGMDDVARRVSALDAPAPVPLPAPEPPLSEATRIVPMQAIAQVPAAAPPVEAIWERSSPPVTAPVQEPPPSEPTRIVPMQRVAQAPDAMSPIEAVWDPSPLAPTPVSPSPSSPAGNRPASEQSSLPGPESKPQGLPVWEEPRPMSPWDASPQPAQVWGAPVRASPPQLAAAPAQAIPAAATPSWLGGSNTPVEEAPWRVGGAPTPQATPQPWPAERAAQVLSGDPPPERRNATARRRGMVPLAIAGGALVVLVLAGATAYYSGLFDSVVSPPPVADTPPRQDKTGREEEQESRPVPKPAEPQPVNSGLKAVSSAADRIAWLHDYPNGPCFYAGATAVSGSTMDMQGLGAAEAPFHTLMADYAAKFGSEANMTVQLIRPSQCVVTEFLTGLRGSSVHAPSLSLADVELADAQAMTGEVDVPDNMRTYLLLVDDDGVAHNISRFLDPTDGKSGFSVPIVLDSKTKAMAGGVPQVLLAITASGPVASLDGNPAARAENVLPGILRELRDKKLQAAATARYFVIGG